MSLFATQGRGIARWGLAAWILSATFTGTSALCAEGQPAHDQTPAVQPAEAERSNPYAQLLAHLGPLGDRSAVRQVGVVSSLANVFPGEPPKAGEMQAELVLSAARREYESAQIVLSAGPEALPVDRVEVAALARTDGRATIPAACVGVRLVGYTYVDKFVWRGTKRFGLWPDPLLRFRPFVCPAGQARCLWVTVQAPEDAAAGDYEGAIRLFSGDRCFASVPVRLRVLGFALPPEPRLHTSYWTDWSSLYDPLAEEPILDDMIRMFGAYRVSTSVFQPGDAVWYREADGTITCEWDRMRRRLELAAASGFRTLNVGPGRQGNAGDSRMLYDPVVDRATGRTLDATAAPENTPEARVRAYLVPVADWLEERGLLDRAYLQIRDEEPNRSSWSSFKLHVDVIRGVEPRIPLLSVLGIHPMYQGWFDIASPHLYFYHAETYRMVREGVSLSHPKSFAARVSASSSGGFGGAAFYPDAPEDAYDGCNYTKWTPKQFPTEDEPEWLRFDFESPADMDGLRLEPFGSLDEEVGWFCEGSPDGNEFQPLRLTARGDGENRWSFPRGLYQAVRLVWTRGQRAFVATDKDPVPPQIPMIVGAREVEFLREGLPPEAARPRERVRPVPIWEYQIGPCYPGVTIQTDPAEVRATGWHCWVHEDEGYLNYGGAQWSNLYAERARGEDPLVWTAGKEDGSGPGSAMIVYPGVDEVLPSVRLARFRDGMDDSDCLSLLAEKRPSHPLLGEIRRLGGEAYKAAAHIETNRRALNDALGGPR